MMECSQQTLLASFINQALIHKVWNRSTTHGRQAGSTLLISKKTATPIHKLLCNQESQTTTKSFSVTIEVQ
jgi:hypothetical protein